MSIPSVKSRISPIQLTIVMHIANGMTLEEIAKTMNYSVSNVSHHIKMARTRMHANNLPHLVSLTIASGDLVWEDVEECRVINGNGTHRPDRA